MSHRAVRVKTDELLPNALLRDSFTQPGIRLEVAVVAEAPEPASSSYLLQLLPQFLQLVDVVLHVHVPHLQHLGPQLLHLVLEAGRGEENESGSGNS